MLFITCDVVELSQVIIISDRLDNSLDIKTQVLFFLFSGDLKWQTNPLSAPGPTYLLSFLYFFLLSVSQQLGNGAVRAPQMTGGTGSCWKASQEPPRVLRPSCPPGNPLARGFLCLLPAKETGKENVFIATVSITRFIAPRCSQGLWFSCQIRERIQSFILHKVISTSKDYISPDVLKVGIK